MICTMVSEELVDPRKINHDRKARILCVHGHVEEYPTATAQIGEGDGQAMKK